jgi:hypothetical protein
MGAPVTGQVGAEEDESAIVFLLERQQQEFGHDIRRELDVERPGLGRNVINILPEAMVGMGRHRFIELPMFHSLKGCDDFTPAKAQGRRAAPRNAEPVTLSLSTASNADLNAARS